MLLHNLALRVESHILRSGRVSRALSAESQLIMLRDRTLLLGAYYRALCSTSDMISYNHIIIIQPSMHKAPALLPKVSVFCSPKKLMWISYARLIKQQTQSSSPSYGPFSGARTGAHNSIRSTSEKSGGLRRYTTLAFPSKAVYWSLIQMCLLAL